MKVKLCNSLFEVANIREQTDTTGQAKLSERPKRRISVKLTIWLAHLCQFVPGTKSHNWVASRVKNRTVRFKRIEFCRDTASTDIALVKIIMVKVQYSNLYHITVYVEPEVVDSSLNQNETLKNLTFLVVCA